MKDKRSNPAHRAGFESTMSEIQRALELRFRGKTRAELECLAAQITRLRQASSISSSERPIFDSTP